MQPPYSITPKILKLITSISEKIGSINANYLNKPKAELRKQNKIKTIHSSLQIEGNTLSEEQITALLENKRVVGSQKDVQEVLNAIEVYENVQNYNPNSSQSFLKAHKTLLKNLIANAGNYRKTGVGIVKGSKIAHLAPPAENVPFLMKNLFDYVKKSEEITLIKSCVFHYEMEFIHPFLDGNGRMGRLWQTLILMQEYPIFEFIPFETLISKNQDAYYNALSDSDKVGNSTIFIAYMLSVINASLAELLNFKERVFTQKERLDYFVALGKSPFSRKDYLTVFKDISSATASRDLKSGIALHLFVKSGEKNKTIYRLK